MTDRIDPDQYQIYASIIRSGQLPDADATKLVKSDPAFEAWYVNRQREARKVDGHGHHLSSA